MAQNETRLLALRNDVARSIIEIRQAETSTPFGTVGFPASDAVGAAGDLPSAFVDEIKRQIQAEMPFIRPIVSRWSRRGSGASRKDLHGVSLRLPARVYKRYEFVDRSRC